MPEAKTRQQLAYLFGPQNVGKVRSRVLATVGWACPGLLSFLYFFFSTMAKASSQSQDVGSPPGIM